MGKLGKILGFNIIVAATIANIFFVYFNNGSFTPVWFGFGWLESVWMGLSVILLVWIMSLLVNSSFVVSRAVTKKNLLRIPFFVYLIMFLVCFVYLIIDLVNKKVCYSCISLVVLQFILTILSYLMLKDLHILIERIFSN